jgi:hypothetical protein
MDVHPPLAKLLLTLAGWLAGFNGDFDFKDIGKDYLEPGVPYVAMRMVPAIFGVMTIPTMFLTLKASGCRTMTAALGSLLVLFGTLEIYLLEHQLTSSHRKRPPDTVSTDPARLASDNIYCNYGPGMDMLYKPT